MNNQEVDIESKDPVIEQLVAELRRRSAVGLQKYGKPLSRDDLKLIDWLRHALEETLDKAGYLQAAINRLKSGHPPFDSEGTPPAQNEHGDVFHHLMALMRGLKVQNPLYWLTKEPKYLYRLGADISSKIDGDL